MKFYHIDGKEKKKHFAKKYSGQFLHRTDFTSIKKSGILSSSSGCKKKHSLLQQRSQHC